jgi:hypothetical protein
LGEAGEDRKSRNESNRHQGKRRSTQSSTQEKIKKLLLALKEGDFGCEPGSPSFFRDLTSAFFEDHQLNKNNLAFVKIVKKL